MTSSVATTATTPIRQPSTPASHRRWPWVAALLLVALLAAAIAIASQRGPAVPGRAAPAQLGDTAAVGTIVGRTGTSMVSGAHRTGADAERHYYGVQPLVDGTGGPVDSSSDVTGAGTGTGTGTGRPDPVRHFFGSRGDQ
jgi:hypothetical protein